MLAAEEQKLANRYTEFAQANPAADVKVALEQSWRADEAALQVRRNSANSLISALRALSKGFADLAKNAHSLTAKELPALLAPYVTEIQNLIPQIQKAF